MSKTVHQEDFRKTKFTPKSAYILSKLKLQLNDVSNQIYFKSTVFNIRLYKRKHNNNLLNKKSQNK